MRIAPKGGRGRKQAKRKRGRGGEAKVRGKEKHPFQKLWTGGSSKKSLVFRKERLFFYLKKRNKYGSAPPK